MTASRKPFGARLPGCTGRSRSKALGEKLAAFAFSLNKLSPGVFPQKKITFGFASLMIMMSSCSSRQTSPESTGNTQSNGFWTPRYLGNRRTMQT
eukprot:CAMPEP_0180530794 /NCGR_PEP_ID=MMETSP1036_2-20121128/62133_1 /TAXON_ID=632150 /ORGANISM="Azadinium spinosum, Strain 3D9" /LENGTH=94 /DNA_ID=CAMNT_0022544667 /DNA_START=167 /DNA_END=451 /DNA_ORIENTATION=-